MSTKSRPLAGTVEPIKIPIMSRRGVRNGGEGASGRRRSSIVEKDNFTKILFCDKILSTLVVLSCSTGVALRCISVVARQAT